MCFLAFNKYLYLLGWKPFNKPHFQKKKKEKKGVLTFSP